MQPDSDTDCRAGGIDPSVLCAVIGLPIGRAVVGAIIERPKHRSDDQRAIQHPFNSAILSHSELKADDQHSDRCTIIEQPFECTVISAIVELPKFSTELERSKLSTDNKRPKCSPNHKHAVQRPFSNALL